VSILNCPRVETVGELGAGGGELEVAAALFVSWAFELFDITKVKGDNNNNTGKLKVKVIANLLSIWPNHFSESFILLVTLFGRGFFAMDIVAGVFIGS
jgi:hypothetical protein